MRTERRGQASGQLQLALSRRHVFRLDRVELAIPKAGSRWTRSMRSVPAMLLGFCRLARACPSTNLGANSHERPARSTPDSAPSKGVDRARTID